jgi:hypothetical protein
VDIELATNDPDNGIALRGIQAIVPDAFECQLEVHSAGFAARIGFWPERFALEQFLGQLRDMDRTLAGNALLQPMCEPEYVRMELERTGAIWVSGEVGSAAGNHLRFGFRTDQTVLAPLIRDMEAVLASSRLRSNER